MVVITEIDKLMKNTSSKPSYSKPKILLKISRDDPSATTEYVMGKVDGFRSGKHPKAYFDGDEFAIVEPRGA